LIQFKILITGLVLFDIATMNWKIVLNCVTLRCILGDGELVQTK